ncbi:flap endonuclease GEN homolog 1 [Rhineura floridana]|uniref:flap endonuclease GEN homolog 1 n=1 Tax=Rhineura floridana TaxID=261503 RepID=UPI002AC7FEB8|nr:flap endonuclease GEN homolog 1 [Rhineura floridana]
MGVTSLWQILEPVKQHVPLNSLKGKTLAVDLSLWVCEAQTVKKMIGIVTKPHLRNLYFRVSSLTLMGIHLVFVMEGDPPELKANTMRKRTEVRFGPSRKPGTARKGRSHFQSLLKECLEMLECLGVPWVQAAGEAEAMCAYLNSNGYVDGCITNDGDAFLYGAQTVYRNFTLNAKDPHVDCYSILAIEEKLGCNREYLIGLAILLGCDYLPKGVPGVGKEQALKLIRALRGQSLLQRFELWKNHFQYGAIPGLAIKKVVHCAVCHHPGTYKDHERIGCHLCGSVGYCEPHDTEHCCPCRWHSSEQDRQASTVEEGIRKKAKACEGFPFPEVIQEYLISKDRPLKLNGCQRPNLLSFQKFAFEKMDWTKHYACEKLCVLLTHYDMNRRKSGYTDPQQLQALRIVKTRTKNGILCFEIEWQKPDHYTTADDQPSEPFLRTMEESSLFQAAYPEVVALYQMEKLEICKGKKGKKNKYKERECLAGDSEVAGLLSRLNLQSDGAAFPNKDSEPEFKTVSDFQTVPEKGSTFQGLSVNANFSTAVMLSQKPPSSSLMTTSRKTEYNCNPGHSPSSQVELTKQLANSYASSAIADLHLSGIDWEGTSFNSSPMHANVTCYSESESDACSNSANQHSLLRCKTAILFPCLNSVQYDPDPLSSEDCSVSESDFHQGQNYLSLKEHVILKPSSLNKASNMVLLNALQMVEQIKGTSSPKGKFPSPSAQLNGSAQQVANVLSEKYPWEPSLPNHKEVLKSSENPVQASDNLTSSGTSVSVGLCTGTQEPICLENKPLMLSVQSKMVLDSCWMRKNPLPATQESSLKKSVCQNSYSSEDSDGESMEDRRKGHRGSKWQRKCNLVHLKDNWRDKRSSNKSATEIHLEVPTLKAPGIGFPAEEPPIVHIHNSPRPTEYELSGSYAHLQAKGSDSDTWADSPLPLSERLKLRLQK